MFVFAFNCGIELNAISFSFANRNCCARHPSLSATYSPFLSITLTLLLSLSPRRRCRAPSLVALLYALPFWYSTWACSPSCFLCSFGHLASAFHSAIQPSSHPAPNAGPNPLASFHCPCRSVCRCLCPPGTMLTIKLNLFSYFVSLRFANSARPLKVKVLSSAADVADNYVPPARTQRTRTAEQGQRTADSLLALSCCKHGAKNSRVSNNRLKKKSLGLHILTNSSAHRVFFCCILN